MAENQKTYSGVPRAERRFTGVPVVGGLEAALSYLAPVEYPVIKEPTTKVVDDMGRRYKTTTPGQYGEPSLAVPAAFKGIAELFKQAVDKPGETASALGQALMSIPEQQMLGAEALMQGVDYAYDPETGAESRFDPFLVTSPVAAGTAYSIARTAGEGGEVLGIMAGQNAYSASKKKTSFDKAKAKGASDREAFDQSQGYIEPSDNAFRFEIDTSDAKLNKKYFEDSPMEDISDGMPYQRPLLEKIESEEGRPATLGDLLEFKKLYLEYPELSDIEIARVPIRNAAGGTKAAYDPIEKKIYVGTAGPRQMVSNILHEVQHAVQDIEGHTPGAGVQQYLPSGHAEKLTIARDRIWSTSGSLIDSKSGFLKKKTLEERAKDAAPEGKIRTLYKGNLARKAKAYFSGDTKDYDYMDFSEFATDAELKELKKLADLQDEADVLEADVIKAGKMYHRQPGEVEARTAQTKFIEGRQFEYPLDVQDVSPEDYIFKIVEEEGGKPRVMESRTPDLPTVPKKEVLEGEVVGSKSKKYMDLQKQVDEASSPDLRAAREINMETQGVKDAFDLNAASNIDKNFEFASGGDEVRSTADEFIDGVIDEFQGARDQGFSRGEALIDAVRVKVNDYNDIYPDALDVNSVLDDIAKNVNEDFGFDDALSRFRKAQTNQRSLQDQAQTAKYRRIAEEQAAARRVQEEQLGIADLSDADKAAFYRQMGEAEQTGIAGAGIPDPQPPKPNLRLVKKAAGGPVDLRSGIGNVFKLYS